MGKIPGFLCIFGRLTTVTRSPISWDLLLASVARSIAEKCSSATCRRPGRIPRQTSIGLCSYGFGLSSWNLLSNFIILLSRSGSSSLGGGNIRTIWSSDSSGIASDTFPCFRLRIVTSKIVETSRLIPLGVSPRNIQSQATLIHSSSSWILFSSITCLRKLWWQPFSGNGALDIFRKAWRRPLLMWMSCPGFKIKTDGNSYYCTEPIK